MLTRGMHDLDTLLGRRSPDVAILAREVIDWLAGQYPEMTSKVKLGWGTVNFRHPRAGFVVAVYPSGDHVSVIYQQGRLLSSPLLVGGKDIKQVRWIPLTPGETVPWDEIGILLVEAIALRA